MQQRIISIVLTGLLASVAGCDKKTETSQPSDTSETAESQPKLSKAEKKFITFMEDNKNFTDNTRCYFKVPKAQQEKVSVDSIATIMLLLSHKIENKQSVSHIDHLIKEAIVRGCNPNEISEGSTPLVHMLIENSHDSLILLLENGADPMLTTQSIYPKIKGKNLFEISALLRSNDKSAERAKTDDLVQSYKAQFEQ